MATISAYNLAIGVQQRRYPYEATIKSGLTVADEFCIVYDKRFDDPAIFTAIDPRVRPIEIEIDFNEWDFVCKALTTARRACKGDWCMYLEMDEAIHEKDSDAIRKAVNDADANGREAVHVRYLNMTQNLVQPERFVDMELGYETSKVAPSRQKIIKNEPFIYHKIADYMIGHLDESDGSWDGRYIKSYAYDDVPYYDERTDAWFNDKAAKFVEDDYKFPVALMFQDSPMREVNAIDHLMRNYSYVWHYSVYNYGRKICQAKQTAIWQDRMYGRSNSLDVDTLVKELQTPVVIDPEISKKYIEDAKKAGWLEMSYMCNRHPCSILNWLKTMGVDAV